MDHIPVEETAYLDKRLAKGRPFKNRMKMPERIADYQLLLEKLEDSEAKLSSKTATVGFDGFIDMITRVVRSKTPQSTRYFETIAEFGEYTSQQGRNNFSIELDEVITKIGGNMPITANAIGCLGAKVECIGSLGFPFPHPLFTSMSPNCRLHSFADPGTSQILEFKDGKIMLANIGKLNKIEWNFINETIGEDLIKKSFTKADLIALLNWSELDNSTAIWEGLLRDVLSPSEPQRHKPIGFFDLSDCSKRSTKAIHHMLELLQSFSKYWRVHLSLNLNESKLIYKVIADSNGKDDPAYVAQTIQRHLKIDTVVVHFSTQALSAGVDGEFRKESEFIKNPTISTGAGDNFNAGYCCARLLEMNSDLCLLAGHTTSHFYMQHGRSGSLKDVIAYVESKAAETERITP